MSSRLPPATRASQITLDSSPVRPAEDVDAAIADVREELVSREEEAAAAQATADLALSAAEDALAAIGSLVPGGAPSDPAPARTFEAVGVDTATGQTRRARAEDFAMPAQGGLAAGDLAGQLGSLAQADAGARDWMAGKAVDPRDAGCKCDDANDDAPAYQALIDDASAAYLATGRTTVIEQPRGRTSLLKRMLVLKSGVSIVARDGQSGFRTDGSDGALNTDFRHAAFSLGNGHPYFFDARNGAGTLARLPIDAAAKGADRVTITAPGDRPRVAVGTKFYVRSVAEYGHPAGGTYGSQPRYYVQSKAASVDAGTGVVVFADGDALEEDVPAGFICPVPDGPDAVADPYMGIPWHCAENVGLYGLRLDSSYPIDSRGLAYGVTLDGLRYPRTTVALFFANGLTHGRVRDLRGRFARSLTEIKMGCRRLVVEDVKGAWGSDGLISAVIAPAFTPLGIGENCYHVHCRDLELNIPGDWPGGGYWMVEVGASRDTELRNVRVLTGFAGSGGAAGGVPAPLYVHPGYGGLDVPPARELRVVDCCFDGPAGYFVGILLGTTGGGADTPAKDVLVSNTRFLHPTVTSWLYAAQVEGLLAAGNRFPAGATAFTGGAAAGSFDVSVNNVGIY